MANLNLALGPQNLVHMKLDQWTKVANLNLALTVTESAWCIYDFSFWLSAISYQLSFQLSDFGPYTVDQSGLIEFRIVTTESGACIVWLSAFGYQLLAISYDVVDLDLSLHVH